MCGARYLAEATTLRLCSRSHVHVMASHRLCPVDEEHAVRHRREPNAVGPVCVCRQDEAFAAVDVHRQLTAVQSHLKGEEEVSEGERAKLLASKRNPGWTN